MSNQPGVHRLGPGDATLSVRTQRAGAAAKAGHDLTIHVTSWEAMLELGDQPATTSLELSADPASLRVREGTGGLRALGDDDIESIHETIDAEVLRRQEIRFRSTRIEAGTRGGLRIEGELTLAGRTGRIAFELAIGDDGKLSAATVVKQTAWGIKPYAAFLGTLKVHDEVAVMLDGHLGAEGAPR